MHQIQLWRHVIPAFGSIFLTISPPLLGQITYEPITGDADSGIESSKTYTHAIDFGNQPSNGGVATINGVVFANGGGGDFPSKVGTSQTVGSGSTTIPRSHNGDNNANVSGGMEDLVHDMVYNDATAEIGLTGLTPGQPYRFRLYNRQWGGGAGSGRGQDIGFDTDGLGSGISGAEDSGEFEQDNATLPDPSLAAFNTVNALTYEYTLSPGVTTLKVYINRKPGDNGTYHLYGLTNEVAGPDINPPKIEIAEPADNSTGAFFRASLVATFDEEIALTNSGTIILTDLSDGSDNRTINLPSSQVTVSGTDLTISPSTPLEFSTEYEVAINALALTDVADTPNPYGGTTPGEWTFTTDAQDPVPPMLAPSFPFFPVDETPDLALDTKPDVLFDKNIVLGEGAITLRNLTNGQDTVIPTSDTSQLKVVGYSLEADLLTINPTVPLDPASRYAILIDPTAVLSYSEVAFAGITDNTTWNIETVSVTTFAGDNKIDGDNWSVVADWTFGVPFGALDAEIVNFKQVTSDGGYAQSYTGDLTLGFDSLLQIGYQSPSHQADFNALGTPGISTIFMKNGSELVFRAGNNNGASPTPIPAVELLGDATITMATGSDPVEDYNYAHGITGTHRLTLRGKGDQDALLTTANNFTELVFASTEGSYDVFAEVAGSLGGNVTVEAYGGGPAADLTIAAADAIADTATLSLNGATAGTLVTMNADDTVAFLVINGFSYPSGTYGRIGTPVAVDEEVTWIAGNSVLTVAGQSTDPISPTTVTITDDSVNEEVFITVQPTITFTLTFNEPGSFTGGVGDFVNNGSAPVSIASVTQISDRMVEVAVTAGGTGTIILQGTAATSFEDLFGNTLHGPFTDGNIVTVRDLADMGGQLGILDLSLNGGVNPATGDLWQVGDGYRFIFATSTGTSATSGNIQDYNNIVQNLANASSFGGAGTLGSVTWKVLASTADVSAKTNTGTDSGTGESFWLLNGTSLVADNYADLYASNSHSSSINVSETGGRPYDGGDYTSVWTGSDALGGIKANDQLGAPDGTTKTGLWGATSGAHWIDRFSIDQTKVKGIYGVSEVLTIQSLVLPAPEIAVRQDLTDIPHSVGSQDFGPAVLNSDNDLVFTIHNFGDAALNLTGSPRVDVISGDIGDFNIELQPTTNPVPAFTGTTTFIVRFKPQAAGSRGATVSIANDDMDENPFTFMVTGTGTSQTAFEAWATGDETFDGDANGDGVRDGIAFLLGAAHPDIDASGLLPTVSEIGGDLVLTFNCLPVAARGGATLSVQHSSALGVENAWASVQVPDTGGGPAVSGVSFVIEEGPEGPPALNSVMATIDSDEASGGKLFGRLNGAE